MYKGVQLEMRQSYAFVARNFNLVKRYWGWEVVWLAYSIANSLSVTFIGAGAVAITGQEGINTDYLITYLLIGTLVWRFLAGIFNNISEMIQWERWEGTIEYTFMAPVRRFNQMIGQTIFAVVYSFLFTIVIGIAVAAFFSLDLSDADFLAATVVLMAGSISFVGLGIVASILPLLYPERGGADDPYRRSVFPAGIGDLLPSQRATGMAANFVEDFTRHLCAGRHARGAATWDGGSRSTELCVAPHFDGPGDATAGGIRL